MRPFWAPLCATGAVADRWAAADAAPSRCGGAAAKITLLFVVFVDLIGQGLVFPVLNGLIMEPDAGFLPRHPAVRPPPRLRSGDRDVLSRLVSGGYVCVAGAIVLVILGPIPKLGALSKPSRSSCWAVLAWLCSA